MVKNNLIEFSQTLLSFKGGVRLVQVEGTFHHPKVKCKGTNLSFESVIYYMILLQSIWYTRF